MKIGEALTDAANILRENGVESARLDAELLLTSDNLRFAYLDYNPRTGEDHTPVPGSREYIAAHPDEELKDFVLESFREMVARRAGREPLAYITNTKEFYGRPFFVTPDVLIPRPETEQLVDTVKEIHRPGMKILDVGTGSGCIAVSLANDPKIRDAQIYASDISVKALDVATRNAIFADDERMDREFSAAVEQGVLRSAREKTYPVQFGGITFLKSDLLGDVDEQFDIIVANLPYLNPEEKFAPELSFEPSKALFATARGLGLIKKLIRQAPEHLAIDGFLTLEMNRDQIEPIAKYATANGFAIRNHAPFSLTLQRLSSENRD